MHLRIALADDQDLVREGIKSLLALSGQVAVAVEARNGDELLSADLTGIDIVVLDIRMPGRDGLEALRELRRRGNPVPVLMLTTFDEPALFEAATAICARTPPPKRCCPRCRRWPTAAAACSRSASAHCRISTAMPNL